jgi:hypothetical protein
MPEIEPKFLCIIATPRTGSSYVCAMLRHIAGVRSKTEIFHRAQAFSVTPAEVASVGVAAQRRFDGPDDPELTAWMRQYPLRAMRAIAREPGGPPAKMLSFKIFPDQLPVRIIRTRFIALAEMRFLAVKRRIIDAYISLSKARLLQRWGGVDTTEISVTLDAAAFVRYVEHHRRWYDTLSAELANSGKSCPELRYEEFAAVGAEDFVQTLATMLHGLGGRGLTPMAETPRNLPLKQDRSSNYEDKVTNWAEFLGHPLVRGLNIDIFGYF